jgi:energy-coupling factor transporter ATP-binding protein EcfA2
MSQISAPRIERITIRGLFGAYDYTLEKSEGVALGDTVILYGDNGSGKTTILRLVFHMLSAANNRGHRHAIARTPFKSFGIEMSNGVLLRAERPGEDLIGAYDLLVEFPDRETLRCPYDPKPPNAADESRWFLLGVVFWQGLGVSPP